MKENPFISSAELLSRSTFAKIDSNDVVEVMELLREEATDDGGREPTVALLGGGGHKAVSCSLRLGVLGFVMLMVVLAAIACTTESVVEEEGLFMMCYEEEQCQQKPI